MHYKIEEQTKLHMMLMLEAYGRDLILSESKNRRSLRLLYEQIDPKQVADGIVKIRQSFEGFKKIFAEFPTSKAMIDEVGKFIKNLPDPASVPKDLAMDDDKKKSTSEVVTKSTDNVVRAMDSVRMGILKVTQGLEPFMTEDASLTKVPIGELIENAKKYKIPNKSKFEAGVSKAFAPSGEYQSAVQRGMKAAQQSTGAEGKTKLGKLFSTIAKFFTGFSFQKSSVDSFPSVFKAFMEFLKGVNYEQLTQISGKLKAEGGKLIISAAQESGETGAQAAAAAGGAPVVGTSDDKGKGESGEKDDKGDEGKVDPDATPPDEVDDNLKDSLRDAAEEEEDDPLQAVLTGIEDWKDSLSKTSQKELTAKGRFDKLKDAIQGSVGKKTKKESIEKAVAGAVKDWVNANQEELVKSGKFAKKNFEALNTFIPQLVAHIEKKVKKESAEILTVQDVRKIVFAYMNKAYLGPHNVLNESSQFNRWHQLAGIK